MTCRNQVDASRLPPPGTCLVCGKATKNVLWCANCKDSPRALGQVKTCADGLFDPENLHREIKGLLEVIADYRAVIEKCKDVLAQFCGESAPVIAHPQKCGFYRVGLSTECNCTAKNTANDVLLSLKACREILGTPAEETKSR